MSFVKRKVFTLDLNEVILLSIFILVGSLFHKTGADTENDRSPIE